MTEVVPYTRRPPERSYAADWLLDPAELAQRIGGTDFVPQAMRNNPAAITAALLYGEEVGLAGPMTSLARIAVINGRPTLAAEAQRALILAAGHDLWIDELTITRCTVAGRRRDSDNVSRITWTMDDAKRAGLAGKQNWRLYPRQMLLARASAELARAIFPDAIGGLAATEELEDEPTPTPIDNGDTPPAATRRRRRSGITVGGEPSAPVPPAESEPTPEPPAEPSEAQGASQAAGDLPPDEQAIVDQLERDFDATERTESAGAEAGTSSAGSGAERVVAPVSPAEPAPPITEPQRRKIHALFRDKGIADRAERLTYCGQVIGRDVPTSTELTVDEASQIIDHLEQYDPDNPQTWPLPI